MPFLEGQFVGDEGVQGHLSLAHHDEDLFPDVPGVAEGALEGDALGEQGVEAHVHRLGTPGDLVDDAAGHDDVHGYFQGCGWSRRVDHLVESVAFVELGRHGLGIHRSAQDVGLCRPVGPGDFEALFVTGSAEDDDVAGSRHFGHVNAQDADGAGAEDGHGVAGLDAHLGDDHVVGHADGFGAGGVLEGDRVGNGVEDSLRNGDEFGEGAVDTEAVSLAFPAEAVVVGLAEDAFAAEAGMGFGGDPIAGLPVFYVRTDFFDGPREFVPEDDGHRHGV